MKSSRFTSCFALALLLLQFSPAWACINDRETFRTEREFRTNYEFKSGEDEQKSRFEDSASEKPQPVWGGSVRTWSGFGLALMACGVVGYNLRGASLRRS